MQALCVVSPEWVQQAGNLHDRANPRNIALFDQAKAWAESWAGKGAVFGVRLDLDEKSGAVVDLMIAPVRDSRGKPVISTQKPLTELKGATDERNEYSALQTSWAAWCATNLDAKIERGLRRELTAPEHLSPETYGMVMDKAREVVQRPFESLLGVVRAAEVSGDDADELREYLLLKGEISRHKDNPHGYAHLTDPDAAVSLPERRRGAILGLGGETEAEWRERASEDVSHALRGVQAARHRENRAHAVEMFTLKQQVTGTPKMREEVSNLQYENRKLQRELKATETRAELIAKENRRLRAVQDGLIAGGRAFAKEKGLDEKALVTRLQTAAKEALDAFDAPAAKPVVKAKTATRTRVTPQAKAAVEASAHAPKKKPIVQEQVRDEPVAEHRIKPKDDAWDDGH